MAAPGVPIGTKARPSSVTSIMQELSSQQAANMLGVPVPFLVGLLDNADIPFHKTGTNRRIYMNDLLAYREKRDEVRKRILGELAQRDVDSGMYDQIYIPAEGE